MNGRALALSVLVMVGASVVAVKQRGPDSAPAGSLLHSHDAVARSSDDALRRAIARAIYGHPTFWRDAAMPEPPIHIVVSGGHVVLSGTVAGEVERALACSLAQGHGELSVTNQLRTRGTPFN
ncbi:MAG TPA: BON domain-containing protein [Vicinamibacterales bacterium]|nr:BON domain-containing protein [Vicinamibacterales bacterium]